MKKIGGGVVGDKCEKILSDLILRSLVLQGNSVLKYDVIYDAIKVTGNKTGNTHANSAIWTFSAISLYHF
jgi:hypothetical protein